MKKIFFIAIMLFFTICVSAQIFEPKPSFNKQAPYYIEAVKYGKNCQVICQTNSKTNVNTYYIVMEPTWFKPNCSRTRTLYSISKDCYEAFKGDEHFSYYNVGYEPHTIIMSIDDNQIFLTLASGEKLSTRCGYRIGITRPFFKVIYAKDTNLIGATVTAQVLESRKSNLSGSEGRLSLMPLVLTTKDGKTIPMEKTPIMLRGKNRTNVKIWLTFLIVPNFIAGEGVKFTDSTIITANIQK